MLTLYCLVQDLKDFGREAGSVSYADIDRDYPGEGSVDQHFNFYHFLTICTAFSSTSPVRMLSVQSRNWMVVTFVVSLCALPWTAKYVKFLSGH